MLNSITVENAPVLLHGADLYNFQELRSRCIKFILQHFDDVSRTSAFEDMGRNNIELVFEILKNR